MTGKEVFKQAIEFGSPSYIPHSVKIEPEKFLEKDNGKINQLNDLIDQLNNDILTDIDAGVYVIDRHEKEGNTFWHDEWGTGWEDDGMGAKTISYPLIEGYDLLEQISLPQPNINTRFAAIDVTLANRDGRYICANVWFTLFERLWMLRGFDNMLVDPYLEYDNFISLRDRIIEYNLEIIDAWLERDVDGIFFSDDWGSQRSLLINPEDWRKFYQPAYEIMFDRVRKGNAHVWMHMCGNIIDILPDLIDIGLNVVNPVQPQAMDIDYLAKEFGGHVCFNGGIDVQGTMVTGTAKQIRDEVYYLCDTLANFNGGYIINTSHTPMPETPLDNLITLLQILIEIQK